MISDRATLRLERGGALDAEIAPASSLRAARARWPAMRAQAADVAGRALAVDRDAGTTSAASAIGGARRDSDRDLASGGRRRRRRICLRVYLPGLDIAQHGLLGDRCGRPRPPRHLAAVARARREYYVALDALLALTLTRLAPGNCVVVTAPGAWPAAATDAWQRAAPIGERGTAIDGEARRT